MKPAVTKGEEAAYQNDVMPIIRDAGVAWVAMWRRSLAEDGRQMSGGWPGTTAEARAWVHARVTPVIAERGLPAQNDRDQARAARDLYALAREMWRAEASADG